MDWGLVIFCALILAFCGAGSLGLARIGRWCSLDWQRILVFVGPLPWAGVAIGFVVDGDLSKAAAFAAVGAGSAATGAALLRNRGLQAPPSGAGAPTLGS